MYFLIVTVKGECGINGTIWCEESDMYTIMDRLKTIMRMYDILSLNITKLEKEND